MTSITTLPKGGKLQEGFPLGRNATTLQDIYECMDGSSGCFCDQYVFKRTFLFPMQEHLLTGIQ